MLNTVERREVKKGFLIAIIVAVIAVDQLLKVYIKLNFSIGEEHFIIGHWFRLHFIENEGMAWGWKFGGNTGKAILTIFRLIAVGYGVLILKDFITKKYHPFFIYASGLIFAGALGNLIDSLFYGIVFSHSDPYIFNHAEIFPKSGGYAGFLFGKVVDMLYFPLFSIRIPESVPFIGNQDFNFFEPVFNVADASISVGVGIIIFFQNIFFPKSN